MRCCSCILELFVEHQWEARGGKGRRKKSGEGMARERSKRKGNGTVRRARGGKRKHDEREGKERCTHNYN